MYSVRKQQFVVGVAFQEGTAIDVLHVWYYNIMNTVFGILKM